MKGTIAFLLLLVAFVAMMVTSLKQQQIIDKLFVGIQAMDQVIGLYEIQLMACGCINKEDAGIISEQPPKVEL